MAPGGKSRALVEYGARQLSIGDREGGVSPFMPRMERCEHWQELAIGGCSIGPDRRRVDDNSLAKGNCHDGPLDSSTVGLRLSARTNRVAVSYLPG
jgi:hypothetical protein